MAAQFPQNDMIQGANLHHSNTIDTKNINLNELYTATTDSA